MRASQEWVFFNAIFQFALLIFSCQNRQYAVHEGTECSNEWIIECIAVNPTVLNKVGKFWMTSRWICFDAYRIRCSRMFLWYLAMWNNLYTICTMSTHYVKWYISNVLESPFHEDVMCVSGWHRFVRKTGQEFKTIIFSFLRILWNARINWIRFVMGSDSKYVHGSTVIAPCTVS